METPSNKISPEVGVSSMLRHLKNVDLPEPEGPMTTTFSPLEICSLMPFNTLREPKLL